MCSVPQGVLAIRNRQEGFMKNAHFDSLVRVLGSGASRREVLAAVAGVAGV